MPISKEERDFVAYIVDLMRSIGPVNAKSMFGGHGIYLDGVMFGLVADSVLYFKVDKELERQFKARGLEAFTYNKKGKEIKTSYYQAPEETLENDEEMNVWANKAYGAALRAFKNKIKK